jgi:hypothetical protein
VTEYTLDDLRAFAAYEGRDPTTVLAADVAKVGLAEVERLRARVVSDAGAFGKLHRIIGEHEGEIERLRAREKELEGALRPLHDAACRIWDAIIAATVSDELDVDAFLDWLAAPSDRAKAALAAGEENANGE